MYASNKNKKVFVGLSGGVDSAVSAALLIKAGYDVTGVFIRIALPGYPCSAGVDKVEAMRVAAHLRIPFLSIDLSKEYHSRVFASAIADFARGRTPNPDALCNRDIKFGAFFDFAMSRGADFVATGHYAQVLQKGETTELHKGLDPQKDQSYFLWAVPERCLAQTLFPVGNIEKAEVRMLAEKYKLPNAQRSDSQGLCFLGDISIDDMLTKEVKSSEGAVLSETGDVIGVHKGLPYYTLGQRHGFTLFAQTPDTPPHFVIGKDLEKNTITVSTERIPKAMKQTKILLTETNWIGVVENGPCEARFRYRGALLSGQLTISPEKAEVILEEPQYIPEGQSLVLYRDSRALGGGVIDSVTLLP